mmetsp:Transcript_7453/g.18269  ORF Transcript_7453/g.18269 Transcript_7453/m.18269 type:complete len:207 (-) Transcript_7453:535-1155(-)|eukprot:CAMPEP_0116099388 /NCGR_PEP_ID=MMETSP0327-20121206/11735_1 /TAXON_ID=44447 /ORGANISM="Pseudo-nitzschia delicatissima, Strain B596" /LENGTH=206 /DNA_ID=CAMNT_0003591249 /DNA_START=116 /DNA_END=736 /DNA_ORIENTATION=-
MGLIIFAKHIRRRMSKPLQSNNQDLGVAIALYVVYPAILWLMIDKFHGICGFETYEIKQEAIAANNAVFLWFTALMRTHKLATILLFQADASDKEEDPHEPGQDGDDEDEGCTRQKCRVWFLLSQELTAIGCVAFLLLICLPVLAFWFMFISIFVSAYNIFSLLKRLWRDAHSDSGRVRAEEDGEDVEFQEFLSNFNDDVDELNGN